MYLACFSMCAYNVQGVMTGGLAICVIQGLMGVRFIFGLGDMMYSPSPAPLPVAERSGQGPGRMRE